MTVAEDLSGRRFGLLVALRADGRNSDNKLVWLCRCDCGREHKTIVQRLKAGITRHCGCLRGTHRASKTKMFAVWCQMRLRCASDDHRYGGRGIKVCVRWNESYEAFRDDMEATYQPGLQIDRIDNDGNYEPDNCRWATRKVQNRNRSTNIIVTYQGERMTLIDASEASGINKHTLNNRYHCGLTEETGLFAPTRRIKVKGTDVGERIVALRAQGMGPDEIAAAIGCHRNTVFRYGEGCGRHPKKPSISSGQSSA